MGGGILDEVFLLGKQDLPVPRVYLLLPRMKPRWRPVSSLGVLFLINFV